MSQQQTVLRVATNIPGSISGSTTFEFLDLYGDIPIKINKSFAELQDISKRNSDYSIGLQLPGSKKNNKFFESYFNVDAQSLYFNATLRVPCDVLLNDQSYFKGYMRLNKVSVLESKIEYDVTLYSTVGDLFGKIGNNLLKDLNYDANVTGYGYEFNHEFDSNVVRSQMEEWAWSGDLEPLYFYPVLHNGYNYSGDTINLSGSTSGQTRLYTSTIVGAYASYAAAYAAGVKRYRLNSPQDGLIDNQLKPALSIKGLITLMFQQYGYTIKSDFFNTPWFRMLYMYGYFSSEATTFSYKVQPKSDTVSDKLAVKLTETFVDTTDPVCSNIKTTRTYKIQLVNNDTGVQAYSPVDLNIVLNFKEYPCGSTTGYNTFSGATIPANTTGTTFTWVSNEFVPCPSTCKLRYTQNFGVNSYRSDVPQYSTAPPGTVVYYQDFMGVEFSKVIDWNIKQIDILSSVAKKFNLVFIPDPDVPNQIIIEPYTYYIGSGDVHDWTNKISWDKGFTVEPALNYVESELVLTDQEDGDYGNKSFKDQTNRIYGENNVYNTTDFKSQSKKIDTLFSPELLRQWDTPETAPNGQIKLPLGINYAANSSSQTSGGNEKIVWTYPGVKTKPKLFYLVGSFNPFLDTFGEVFNYSGNVLTNQVYISTSDGTVRGGRNTIPLISHTLPIGNPDTNKITVDTISNLFNSEYPTAVGTLTGGTYNVYTNNDAYQLFYSNRVNNLYDANTRFLNGYFDLKLSDIQNLKPKDLIKINEQYFTWNKIDNFNLTNRELTKVELIQYNSYVNEYPKRYFKYYYCDNPSKVYKFETDFTNANLKDTNYGWSVLYDYNVGILLDGAQSGVSGYTSCIRDLSQGTGSCAGYTYVGYYIYEVSEADYNASGLSRDYDSLYQYLDGGNFTLCYPAHVYTAKSGYSFQQVFNLFIDCTNFNYYATTYGICTGSSTTHSISPTPTATLTRTPTPTPTVTGTPTPTPTFGACTYYQVVYSGGAAAEIAYTDCSGVRREASVSGTIFIFALLGSIICLFGDCANLSWGPAPTPTPTPSPSPSPTATTIPPTPTATVAPVFPTSGLTILLDAATYTGGTIWYDTSGNNYNATLIDTPTWSSTSGGTFSFNSSPASITEWAIASGFTQNQRGPGTAIIFYEWSDIGNNLASNWGIYSSSTTGRTLYHGTYEAYRESLWAANSAQGGGNGLILDYGPIYGYSGITMMKATTWTNTGGVSFNQTEYKNNAEFVQSETKFLDNINLNTLKLGAFYGKIYLFGMWNKVLTTSEISAVYNIYRSRFGI
jgi:hypothetical protein